MNIKNLFSPFQTWNMWHYFISVLKWWLFVILVSMKVFFSQCVCVLLSIWCLRGSSGTVGEQLWVGNYLKEEKWFLITHALSQVWILKTYFEVETLINDWRECGVSSLPHLTVLLFIRQFCCLFLMSNSITLEWLDVKHALTDIFGCRNKMQLYWYDKNLSKQFPTYLHTQRTQTNIHLESNLMNAIQYNILSPFSSFLVSNKSW